jgi:hypothetical protein
MAPQLRKLGMVTDALWFDDDQDGLSDLIVVGDWLAITVFKNDGKKLVKLDNVPGLEKSEGWWNSISGADIDKDGDTDFVLGNLGRNSKFTPTADNPVSLYVYDFDQNGSMEPIFTFHKDGEEYPLALRQDIVKQMSSLKKQFVYYKDYADKTVSDIYESDLLQKATKQNFYEPNTIVLLNHGQKGFERRALPVEAQFSPVYGIHFQDANQDGNLDIMLGGNLFAVKPEVGKYDAMHGLLLTGDGAGTFKALNSRHSGVKVQGEVRHVHALKTRKGELLAFVRNNDSIQFYKLHE